MASLKGPYYSPGQRPRGVLDPQQRIIAGTSCQYTLLSVSDTVCTICQGGSGPTPCRLSMTIIAATRSQKYV